MEIPQGVVEVSKCKYCKKVHTKLICSICKEMYCSAECQLMDWEMHQVVCCVSNTRPAQPNQFQSSANGHLPPNNIAKSVQNRLVAAASAPPVPQRSFQNQGSLDTKQSSLFGNDAKQVVRQPWTFTSPLNNTLETEYKEFLIQFVKNPTVGIALPSVWLMAAELENEFYDYLNDLNIRYEQGDCLKEKTIYQAKLGDLVIAPYDGDYYRCEVIGISTTLELRLVDCGDSFTLPMISLAKIPNQLEVAKPAFAFEVRLENVSTKDYENFAIEERILARIYENATGEKVGFINLDSIASKVVGPPSGAPPKLPAEITDWKQHLDIDLPVNQFTDYIIQYVMINRPDGRPPALIVIEPEFEADFLDYTYNISEKYKDIMPVNVDQLSVGSLVVALFEDELYYRAQVLSITPISLRLIDCGNEFTLDNWKNVKYPLPEERKKRAYAFEVELLNAEHLETNSLDVGDRVQLNISSKDGRKVALLKDHQRIPVDGQSTALQPSQIMTQTEEKQKRTLADPVDDNAWRKHQPEILRVNEYDEYVVQHVQIASDTLNSSLWVSLPHLENELLDYLQDITDRYSKVVSVRLEQLVAGDLVIAHFDDDLFYRSRVKAINRKSCALRLQLIDYGNIFVLNDITEVKMPADVDMRKLAYAFEVLIADTDIGQIQTGDKVVLKIISTTCDGLKIGVIKEVLESFPSTNTPPQNGLKPQSLLSTPQNADLSKQPRVMFTQMPIKEMLIGKQTREIKVNVLDVSRLDQNEITVCENNKENLLFYEEINDLIDKYVQEHPNNGNYEPTMNELVLALFESSYYRAVCLSPPVNNMVRVYFCDFGNECILPINKVMQLPKTFLYPCCAHSCVLKGLDATKKLEDMKSLLLAREGIPVLVEHIYGKFQYQITIDEVLLYLQSW